MKSGKAYDIMPVSNENAKRIKRQGSKVHPHVITKRDIEDKFKNDYVFPPETTIRKDLMYKNNFLKS